LKYISQVGINLSRSGAQPGRYTIYVSLVRTDDMEPIDEELDAAVGTDGAVTWTVEENGTSWDGAIYSREQEAVERARRYLVESKGWTPENVKE
jgi:hypothetical protein